MSELKDVAEHSANICAATLAFAGAGAISPFLSSFAVLGALGLGYWSGTRSRCRDSAARKVTEVLKTVPEFAHADWGRVAVLLTDTRAHVSLDPGKLERASRAGAAGFREALLTPLTAAIPAEAGEDLHRRAASLALGAALDCLLSDPEARAAIEHAVLLNLARDAGLTIQTLARVEDKVDAVEVANARRHQELMAYLRQSDDYRTLRAANITETAIIELARRIAADVQDVETAFRELTNTVGVAVRVQAAGGAESSHDDFVDRVMDDVARLAREGAYDDAAAGVDAALAREEAESSARMLRLLDAGIDQDTLRRDAPQLAARLARKAELQGKSGIAALWPLCLERHERGQKKGVNFDLAVSVELARLILSRAANPNERGSAGNLLANALQALGKRETGTARLKEALATYRAVLEEWTQEKAPLDWAMTQNNLATGLVSLGERESGTSSLEQALVAYRAALEVRTRENVPLNWAATQNNLGVALRSLGDRKSDATFLKEAVVAFRAALEERTRERGPLDWAETQNNLGIVLRSLGERESGTAGLEEAVAAYRAALEVRTRENGPLNWAATQNNLGVTLQTLGERETGTARLAEAVVAFREALQEYTPEKVPLEWAAAWGNQGVVLAILASRTGDLPMAEAALNQIIEARDVLRDGGHAVWAGYFVHRIPKVREIVTALQPVPVASGPLP